MGFPIVQFESAEFPTLIREIPDPPERLYLRGTLPDENPAFLCVVGSRKYTPYGKEVCRSLIRGLAGYPIVIVSGLALGIDALAHEAALEAGLVTLGIPGSGLSDQVLYPRSNLRLAQRILHKGGALLSEFPPEHRARPENFPQRNRIMAGLSHAVLVIEAEVHSGTLITARLATDYNRDVLAVPGPIGAPTAAGPHYLLKQGAALIQSADDILEALRIAPRTRVPQSEMTLSDAEQNVLELIRQHPKRDALIGALNLSVSEANTLLTSMEIKGLIAQELGELRALIPPLH